MRSPFNRSIYLFVLGAVACSGGSGGTSGVTGPGPSPPPPPPAPEPTTGSVAVTVRTVGEATDQDGFVLTLDGQPVGPLSPNDQHTLTDLEAGTHEVGLDGVADNCGAHQPGVPVGNGLDPNPTPVRVTVGGLQPLEFIVFCLRPDAGRLIVEQANFRLFSIDAWGGNLQVLTDNIGFDFHTNQDARRMVFFSEGEIWISDLDGTNAIQLTDTPEDEAFPKLSPDGTRIAFNRFVDNTPMIFTMGVDGSDERLVTDVGTEPVWSPDGERIAFYRGAGGVFLTNVDGSNEVRLPSTRPGDATPAWLRDGRRIALVRGSRTIVIVDIATGAEQVIGEEASLKSRPSFSPDGRWMAYGSTATRPGQFLFDVWIMPTSGGEAVRVVGGGGAIWLP